jgi:hypothetical protein
MTGTVIRPRKLDGMDKSLVPAGVPCSGNRFSTAAICYAVRGSRCVFDRIGWRIKWRRAHNVWSSVEFTKIAGIRSQ